ncbi:hypothetical protein NPIL_25801 [Nephila pilipes]|uniref:Uncharacterized protein n=1 Tax=Nephila pilipes TaxID=299642 RepID=A0A8X6JY12_NEPPI|nr:hypothetical protein NPIL_446321 [Nephila pilipes]GFS89692.1 hypothetical protein NPIL_25801 [Nephila pilipes]
MSRKKVFKTAEEAVEYLFSEELESEIIVLPPEVDEFTDEEGFDDSETLDPSVRDVICPIILFPNIGWYLWLKCITYNGPDPRRLTFNYELTWQCFLKKFEAWRERILATCFLRRQVNVNDTSGEVHNETAKSSEEVKNFSFGVVNDDENQFHQQVLTEGTSSVSAFETSKDTTIFSFRDSKSIHQSIEIRHV